MPNLDKERPQASPLMRSLSILYPRDCKSNFWRII